MSLAWLGARIAGCGAWIRSLGADHASGGATSRVAREQQRLLGRPRARARAARLAQPRLVPPARSAHGSCRAHRAPAARARDPPGRVAARQPLERAAARANSHASTSRVEQRRAVEVGERRVAPDRPARPSPARPASCRRGGSPSGGRPAGSPPDEDHVAEVVERVRAPVPHVERVDAVVGVATSGTGGGTTRPRRRRCSKRCSISTGSVVSPAPPRRSRRRTGGAPGGTRASTGCVKIITPPSRTSGAPW